MQDKISRRKTVLVAIVADRCARLQYKQSITRCGGNHPLPAATHSTGQCNTWYFLLE